MNLFILYGDGGAHTTTCVQKPEDPLPESFLSFYQAVPRNQIQVTTLYSLGHLTSTKISLVIAWRLRNVSGQRAKYITEQESPQVPWLSKTTQQEVDRDVRHLHL